MKMMLVAGLLITLPAIVIVIYFFGEPMMFPALASFAINLIPFVVAALLMGKRGDRGEDLGAH